MVCIKKGALFHQNVRPTQGSFPSSGEFATEKECLENCGMGACCKDLQCAVLPACACTKIGGVFYGVGTTCLRPRGADGHYASLANDLMCCTPLFTGCSDKQQPSSVALTISDNINVARSGSCQGAISSQVALTLQPISPVFGRQDCGVYLGRGAVSVPCFPLGAASFVVNVVFTMRSTGPSWRATIDSTDDVSRYDPNGVWFSATGYGGPPCDAASSWSPAQSCYSGTATLYRYIGSVPVGCSNRWEQAGTLTISGA